MNSRSLTTAPARHAAATPSPVATSGLVVSVNTRPIPPVANKIAPAWMRTCRLIRSSHARAPHTRPPSTSRSRTPEKLWNSTAGNCAACRHSVRAISRPVESPCACSTRLRLCAPSRANSSLSPSRSKSAPHSISRRTSSGPSSTSTCTASARHNPAPAAMVSASCSEISSSSARAAAMPPCAYWEEDSFRLSLATTRTRPKGASSIAARSPATPAPTTRKSVSTCSTTPLIPSMLQRHDTRHAPLRLGPACYKKAMPSYAVTTPAQRYQAIVERGALARLPEFLPQRAGSLFTVTTRDVWELYGPAFTAALAGRAFQTLFFPGGEQHKRLAAVEGLAEEMVALGGDRSSVVIGFGGGIVTDLAGFLAAIFMRGVPFLSVPTTLLAQVDAGVGGKTGANLKSGKNLIGAFHQPLAVLTDPSLLATLPEREYRAGLFEVLKCGVIRSPPLFRLLAADPAPVLRRDPAV